MNNFKERKEKGITLIALVITIIVLIILATVSINAVFGQNGLISKAEQAKEEQRGAEVQDVVEIWKLDKELSGYIEGEGETKEELLTRLQNEGLLTASEKAEIEENGAVTIGSHTISFAKTLVDMFEAAVAANCEGGENCTDPENHLHIGDYITNYNSTLKNSSASVSVGGEKTGVGTQQYQVDTNTTWRVLGLDETGTKLMITTGSPIKKVMKSIGWAWEKDPYLHLWGANGWYWAGEATSGNVLDEICAIYDSKFADKTKSMRIEDINTALGLTLDKTVAGGKLYKTADESQTALTAYMGEFGQSYTYKIGDYAPENYLKENYPTETEYNSLTNKKSGDSVDGTAFMYAYTDASIVDQSSKLFDVLFKGTESEPFSKAYWLAGSAADIGGEPCFLGPGFVWQGICGTRLFRDFPN